MRRDETRRERWLKGFIICDDMGKGAGLPALLYTSEGPKTLTHLSITKTLADGFE